jgi:hypothetical protein
VQIRNKVARPPTAGLALVERQDGAVFSVILAISARMRRAGDCDALSGNGRFSPPTGAPEEAQIQYTLQVGDRP